MIRKIFVSIKFVSAILGREMAAPIYGRLEFLRSFCRKTSMSKFLVFFWGGGYLGFLGGEVPILFLRTPRPATEPRNGPTRNFHEKYRKNTPRPEILDSQNFAQNTLKIPKNAHFGIFSVFLGYFLGVPEFRPGGYFSVFFVEIPGRAISGLCSKSGHSQFYFYARANFSEK